MKARFRTNLDEAKPYVDRLNDGAAAHDSRDYAIGDRVAFQSTGGPLRGFQLQVVRRTVFPSGEGICEIELHIGGGQTIREWSEWFRGHMGGGW